MPSFAVIFSAKGACMPIYRCPDCHGKISDTAESCPKCGAKITPEVLAGIKPKNFDQPKKRDQTLALGVVGCFGVIVLVCAGIFTFGSTTPPSGGSGNGEMIRYDQPVTIQGENGTTFTIPAGT
jgi:hypothetical protein